MVSKKPFPAGEPLAFERTTENLVSWKSENAAALEDLFAANPANLKLPTTGLLGSAETMPVILQVARMKAYLSGTRLKAIALGSWNQATRYVTLPYSRTPTWAKVRHLQEKKYGCLLMIGGNQSLGCQF